MTMHFKGKHIHLMGICGTAMASLAGIFKSRGAVVTGSDQNVYPPMSTQLQNLGIPIMEGYKKENLNPKPDLVIVGNVIRKIYEEAQALLESDIPYTSLPKALGEYVIENRHSIVVSGTHGKTTTTSMMTWVCETAHLKPGFLIGGIPKNFSRSFQDAQGDYFVIEGDEYDTAFFDKVPKFIHYRPRSVILTSIEFDHADIYKDLEDVKNAFKKLMELIPSDGNLIYWAESPNVIEVSKFCLIKNKRSYGINKGDYQAREIRFDEHYCSFDVWFQEKKIDKIRLKVFGAYNVLNALATYALSRELGIDSQLICHGLETFEGVKRRQEVIGTPHGITVIEDFAHHPTAVEMTIQAIKERFEGHRLFSLFEPRSATSRRNFFQEDYVEAFKKSDVVLLKDVFHADQLKVEERLSPEKIVSALTQQGVEAYLYKNTDDMVSYLSKEAKKGDVILIMSNGAFDGIYQKLLNSL